MAVHICIFRYIYIISYVFRLGKYQHTYVHMLHRQGPLNVGQCTLQTDTEVRSGVDVESQPHPRCDRILVMNSIACVPFCLWICLKHTLGLPERSFIWQWCPDQLWGLLSRRLGRSVQMLVADSACTLIKDELKKPSLASFINGEVIVEVLRNYRDWKSHTLQHSPVRFELCLTLHLFTFVAGWFSSPV